jgi:Heat induced stress protein YflT.
MARKFGMFNTQQQIVEAVQQLEQQGFTSGEMKVLAKNAEGSRRVEQETDVHVQEMREMQATIDGGRRQDDGGFLAEDGGYAAAPVAGIYSNSGFGGLPFAGGIGALGAYFAFLRDDREEAYQAMGLDSNETELCMQAVEDGSLVLIVQTDESKSLLDKDGGPSLSKLGVAEGIFRNCGASRIVDGS